MESMQNDAPNKVWGYLKVDFSRTWRMRSRKSKCWVNMSLKFPIIYPIPKPYITDLKDLFDLEGSVLPTLVEINITNKPMGPK